MVRFCLIILSVLLFSSCTSIVKERIQLDSKLDVKVLNRKTEILEPAISTTQQLTDKSDLQYFQVSVGSNVNTFGANYVDEYLYYFKLFLEGSESSFKDLGDAHTLSPLNRMNFSIQNSSEPLLVISTCYFGECKKGFSIYYDMKSVRVLESMLREFQKNRKPNKPEFEPLKPSNRKSILYIYRLNTAPLAGVAEVSINQFKSIKLSTNSCVAVEVDSGDIQLQTKESIFAGIKAASFVTKVSPESIQFIQFSTSVNEKPDYSVNLMLNIFYDRSTFRSVPYPVAVNDIVTCDN